MREAINEVTDKNTGVILRITELGVALKGSQVLKGISLDVRNQEKLFIVGPSGSGKSTLLRAIAGFVSTDLNTKLYLEGRDITNTPAKDRETSLVFQNYALWPHLTVFENVAFGLKVRGFSKVEIKQRTHEIIGKVKLSGYEDRYPDQLSGGQQQRVALARSLIVRPKILMLDEPLSNLDSSLKKELRDELLRLQEAFSFTMIFVTHDQSDALSMADRIAIISAGRLLQIDTPENLAQFPISNEAYSLLGQPVLHRCNIEHGQVISPFGNIPMARLPSERETVSIFLRKEDLILRVR